MAEKAAVAAPPDSTQGQPQAVVLVVDDEEGLRKLVCRTLRDQGYRTLEAGHGREALELVETALQPVDLIITDVVMPEMDGGELGRRVGQVRPDLPVLYMSGYDVNDIFRRGSPRSSAPFLQKPFPAEVLLGAVEQLLKRHSTH
ncbi:MAG: response regulator [Gemmatimonadales bacterium]